MSDIPLTVESLDAWTTQTGLGVAEWRAHRREWARIHPEQLTPLDALLGYLHVTDSRAVPFLGGLYLHPDGSRRKRRHK